MVRHSSHADRHGNNTITVILLLETIAPLLDVVVRERENNIFSREQ